VYIMPGTSGSQGGSGTSGNAFGSNIFLQNLQLLGKLATLNALNFASSLLFNFNYGGGPADNKFVVGLVTPGPNGAEPVGDLDNPFITNLPAIPGKPQIRKAVVYLLGSPLTNQSSPVTILNESYTPASGTTTLLIIGAAQISNTTPGPSKVDVALEVGSTLYTSSRTYQNADIGSTTLYTYYSNVSTSAVTLKLIATLSSGSTNLGVPLSYITVVEF
jgi:hypothetical protein